MGSVSLSWDRESLVGERIFFVQHHPLVPSSNEEGKTTVLADQSPSSNEEGKATVLADQSPFSNEEGKATVLADQSPSSFEEGVRGWSQTIPVVSHFPWNRERRELISLFKVRHHHQRRFFGSQLEILYI